MQHKSSTATPPALGHEARASQIEPRRNHHPIRPPPTLRAHLRTTRSAKATTALRRSHLQRVAVRVSKQKQPRSRIGWLSVGRYLQRPEACREGLGFQAIEQRVDLSMRLDSWYRQGDDSFFKIVISPENAGDADLQAMTQALMARMQQDLRVSLDWVAAVHTNTPHPHVHVAFRERDANGAPIQIDREYLYRMLRNNAREEITRQIGYRPVERNERERPGPQHYR